MQNWSQELHLHEWHKMSSHKRVLPCPNSRMSLADKTSLHILVFLCCHRLRLEGFEKVLLLYIKSNLRTQIAITQHSTAKFSQSRLRLDGSISVSALGSDTGRISANSKLQVVVFWSVSGLCLLFFVSFLVVLHLFPESSCSSGSQINIRYHLQYWVVDFFFKWRAWLTTAHWQITRKWIHPIFQQQLHWAHPACSEAQTNRRNFHSNQTLSHVSSDLHSESYLLFIHPVNGHMSVFSLSSPT